MQKIYNINDFFNKVKIVKYIDSKDVKSDKIILDIKNRLYVKKSSRVEMLLIRYFLPEIKFIPYKEYL